MKLKITLTNSAPQMTIAITVLSEWQECVGSWQNSSPQLPHLLPWWVTWIYFDSLTWMLCGFTYWGDEVGYLLVWWCGLLTGVIVWVTGVIERVTYWGDGWDLIVITPQLQQTGQVPNHIRLLKNKTMYKITNHVHVKSNKIHVLSQKILYLQ